MAKFAVGQSLTTREPAVVVDAGLPAGIHRFQLIVVNERGVKSAADVAEVQVQASPTIPVIRISPVQPLPLRPVQ